MAHTKKTTWTQNKNEVVAAHCTDKVVILRAKALWTELIKTEGQQHASQQISPSMINECHRLAVLNEFQSSRSMRRREQLVAATISGPMGVLDDAGTSQICSGTWKKGEGKGGTCSRLKQRLALPVKLSTKSWFCSRSFFLGVFTLRSRWSTMKFKLRIVGWQKILIEIIAVIIQYRTPNTC